MKATELIEQMRRTNPKLLDGIPENIAVELVRNVFKHINDTLAGTKEGVVDFVDLGRFRVRQVEKEVEGKKITRTQVIFRRAEAGDAMNHGKQGGRGRGKEGRRKGRDTDKTDDGGETEAQR